MRLGKVAALVMAVAASVSACSEPAAIDVEADSVLLEIEYVNFAWVPTWKGFYVDGSGNVFSYDRDGEPWQHAQARSVTKAQLEEKFAPRRQIVEQRDTAEIGNVVVRIGAVNPNQLSQQKQECADAGQLTYRAYRYNSSEGRYEPVLLRVEGDYAQQNTSTAAQDLIAYIRSLDLIQEMLGCDP